MMGLLWVLWGCTPEADAPWRPPTWTGDGLPTDTAAPPDGRDGGDGGGGSDTGEDTAGALEALHIVDGVFGVRDEVTGVQGYLVLSAEPIDCATAMTGADFPYGAYILLRGPESASVKGGWDAEYGWCGEAPCMSDAFWSSSGASGDLPSGSRVSIQDAGPHSLTVQWDTRPPLTVDNCQDVDDW